MFFVTYLRVSTDRQGKSGLGLEAQRAAVLDHVAGKGEIAAEYVEIESGKRNERPQLARAMAEARRIGAVLLIAKLDRLARNVAFIANLLESGCRDRGGGHARGEPLPVARHGGGGRARGPYDLGTDEGGAGCGQGPWRGAGLVHA
jgi:hypothetical protein